VLPTATRRAHKQRKPKADIFRLPELCAAVLEHLDQRSLYAASRVCRDWAAIGLKLLWRDVSQRALLSLLSRTLWSSMKCTGAVRRLSVDAAHLPDVCLRTYSFPRLQHLALQLYHVDAYAYRVVHLLKRYGPELKSLELTLVPYQGGGGVGAATAAAAAADAAIGPHQSGMDIVAALAHCPNLRSLRVAASLPWPDDDAPGLMLNIAQTGAFRQLRAFAASTRAACVPALLATMPLVEQLELSVSGGSAGVFGAVAQLGGSVRRLRLMLGNDGRLMVRDLLALDRLWRLEELHVYGNNWQDQNPARAVSDRELAALVAGMPHLREWNVRCPLLLSPTAYTVIGAHCRQLQRLSLYAPSDMRALETATPAPLFSELRSLCIHKPTGIKTSNHLG
jgi:hypothetical protein